MDLNRAINSFQKKIGTYDKANWEVTVENQDIQQLIDKKLSVANVPTDLLDIDLIRGSTFTKAKPGYHWTQVTYSGILKVLFYPFYYKWWQQQLSFVIWAYFLFLYFLQTIAIGMYLLYQTHDEFKNISWPEALVPLLATVLLGEMFIHVVSTNFSKPIRHTMKKKQRSKSTNESKRSRRKSRQTQRRNQSRNRKTDESEDRTSEPVRIHCEDYDDEGHNESETEVDLSCGIRNRFRPAEAPSEKSEHSPPASSNHDRSQRYDASNPQSGASVDEDSSDNNDNENDSSESASTSSMSDDEVKYTTDVETADVLFPNVDGFPRISNSIALSHIREGNDLINVSIWDGKNYFMKAKLTFFEIGLKVVNKVEQRAEKSSDHIKFAFLGAILIGILPLAYRIYALQILNKERTLLEAATHVFLQFQTLSGTHRMFMHLFGPSWKPQLVVFIAMVSRISLSFAMFFLLCVAEGAYNMRLMYAKYFGALTSTRRARRNGLPHFRLHKVKNIKAWLSLRSFLKKRGPQRSVDTIVSISFMFGMLLLVAACVQFLSLNGKDDEHFLRYFFSWEVSAWSLVLGVFLIRFIALGSDINRKYRNTSILLTEEINLYLQMEKCLQGRDGVKNPKMKKEELLIANNVLKLASQLLKELEVPFKVSGFIMNPLLSNITRVVVLSLFSGVMSDILGFRLRLWKIKP